MRQAPFTGTKWRVSASVSPGYWRLTTASAAFGPVVVTDTPGFTAEIEATNTEGGTPAKVSDSKVVGKTTTFEISSNGPKRYYVIWITKLPPGLNYAHVNEVRAFKG
jgi:hypothetical protein